MDGWVQILQANTKQCDRGPCFYLDTSSLVQAVCFVCGGFIYFYLIYELRFKL